LGQTAQAHATVAKTPHTIESQIYLVETQSDEGAAKAGGSKGGGAVVRRRLEYFKFAFAKRGKNKKIGQEIKTRNAKLTLR